MPYKLVKAVYNVRCRQPHCPFNDHVRIEQEVMGLTEDDVRTEALKMARDQGIIKHDSIYWRRHSMENPEVRMVSGQVRRIGQDAPVEVGSTGGVVVRRFRKGEVILHKGEAAGTVCEVLEGAAYPRTNRSHRYVTADCFGVAALVPNHTRMSDVVAGMDDTVVAFYDLVDLRQSEPGRATRIVSRIMEDTLQVVDELGSALDRMKRGRHRLAS
ncbi:MAG TPA: cyclic nucleotide-binding domain-containing protein [Spirochaetia bacterium]|nr:cyclic nucleotide-binding domain-containing protein [Spirochaetia bacterium]